MKHQYNDRAQLLERARWLRKNQTWPEKRLWARLRRRQVGGYKFRRQYVLEPFIIDFYCLKRKVAVEVDGPVHSREDLAEKDEARTETLEEQYGVKMLRFSVQDIYQRIEEVLEEIECACAERDGEE
ncbi:endonuclease domain-containing protein [Persicimonas caeni]|uniref:endonuclease domain-containing protein n=1 Tax=Persicimonas caeni TaxID=2292766 RepID=UPI00143D0339|nr:endonuclease domain-containing protein [Persicimonas caeni]